MGNGRKTSLLLALLVLLTCVPAKAAWTTTTSIRVLGSNGATTAGVRITETSDDGLYPTRTEEMVYTTDGVNWSMGSGLAEGEEGIDWGYFNGTEFVVYARWGHMPGYLSKDGVRWEKIPADSTREIATCPRGKAVLGPYHFEIKDEELWLVAGEKAVLLQGMSQFGQEKNVTFTDLQAFYVPNGVQVAAYPTPFDYTGSNAYVMTYTTSSLDWVLEHRADTYWSPETLEQGDNGSGTWLRKVAVGLYGERWEVGTSETEGSQPVRWTPLSVHWSQERDGATLLPYNGKTFVVLDNWSLQLYASEDGRTWRCLRDSFLAPEQDAALSIGMPIYESEHALTWTGTEYLACRRTWEKRYGMMGSSGGNWYSPYNTKICFADASWNLTGEYDFGRQVLSVGSWNGTYYAEVSESVGISVRESDASADSVIWTSADRVHWTKTELRQIIDSIQALS